MIKNMAVVNENSAGSVIALQAEVRRLREELLSVAGHRGSSVSQSGKFDRLMELEELLSKSIDDNADLRQEMTKLEMYIDRLKVLSERKDNFVMNSKLVIRLRETQLSKLEQRVRDSYAKVISPSAAEEELREEVNALRSIVELHPEVTRFAMENLELRDSIAKLDSMSDSEAQIAGLKNHIQDLSNQLGTLIKEKHDLMKGDSDKEKTEAIMALRMKLDSQTMDLEEKNEHISLLSAEVERAKNEQICSEQTLQQIQKEMAQKEKDIQDMMILTDEAFQQKKGSTEKMWMAKIQKLQEDFREKDVAHQQELKAQEETVARLRLELAQSQVVNRRLSTHVSFPAADAIEWEEDDFLSPAPRRASSGFPLRDVTSDQMREMQEKIDKFMEEIAQLKEERDTFTDEIKFLRDREQEQNERKLITSNDDEIVSLKSKMAELCEENNSMMDKYSELQGQVLQSHVERDELEDSYKAKLGHIESELCTYKSLLSEKDALIYQLQESASTVAQINITQHVDDAPASTRSAEEDDALTQELREKRAEIDALQIEVAKKTTSLGELLSTVAQEREKCTKLEHELSERSTQHAEAQKKIIELEQECKQLQEDIESANELDLSNIYERQVKKLSAENVALQTKIQELGRAVEEKTAMDAMTQQLRGDNEDLRESLGRMELDVQRLTADTVKLQEDLRMAAERVDVVRQELDEANRAATEAKQEAAEAKRETVEAKQEAAEAKQEAAEAKQEAVEAKQEADRAKEEAKEARQEATSAKQEVEKTKQHDMNEAKQEVEKAKQEVAHIREELRTALESAATQQQHATRHQEHITELEQAKVDLLASHAKELETTRTEKDDLLVRANHAEAQLAKLNAQLREETQKYAELLGHQNHQQKIRHTQQLKTQIDKLQEENQRLKKELAKLRDGTINKSSAMPSPSLSLRNGATKATDSLNTSLNTSQVLAEQDNTHNIHNVSTTNAHVLHLVEAHVSMASPLDRLRHSFSAKEKEAPDHKEPTKQERGDPPTHLDLNNKENIFP